MAFVPTAFAPFAPSVSVAPPPHLPMVNRVAVYPLGPGRTCTRRSAPFAPTVRVEPPPRLPRGNRPPCGLPARPWKDLIHDGLLRRSELELFHQFREATSPGGPPPLQLRQHARKREGRQVEPERLQDGGQNRLPAGAGERLAGATRQARCATPRNVRSASLFVPSTGLVVPLGCSVGLAVTNVSNSWRTNSRRTSSTKRR